MRNWTTSEIARVTIRSEWGNSIGDSAWAETVIERWEEWFFRAIDSNDETSADKTEPRAVDFDLIDKLIQSLNEPPISDPNPINLGVTREWFRQNIQRLIDEAADGHNESGKQRFAARVGNYDYYCRHVLGRSFRGGLQDNMFYSVDVCIESQSGNREKLHTSLGHPINPFGLPWQLGQDRTITYNSRISHAVAALMPDGCVNKSSLLFRGEKNSDSHNDLLDVPERTVSAHAASVCCLFFTLDNNSMVSGGEDNVVKVWNPFDWTECRSFDMPRVGVRLSVELAPNGTMIAFNDATVIKIADINSGHILKELRGHKWVVQKMIFLLNGNRLASEDCDGVRLWDVDSGCEVEHRHWGHPLCIPDGGVKDVHTSLNGCTQVWFSGDSFRGQSLEVLDLTTGRQLRHVFTTDVKTIALPPDGRCLVTGHRDGQLAIWELPAR